jgi:hypothetical protein
VSPDPADINANDALLRRVRGELPDFIASILLIAPDGTNIGRSGDPRMPRSNASNRAYFQQVKAGQRSRSATSSAAFRTANGSLRSRVRSRIRTAACGRCSRSAPCLSTSRTR